MKLRFAMLFLWLLAVAGPSASPGAIPVLTTPPVTWDTKTRDQIRAAQDLVGDIRRHSATNSPRVAEFKARLNSTLQTVPHAFPLLQPSTNAAGPSFRTITFNQQALGLDGFRIKNTSNLPQKFAWACGFKSASLIETWHILPVKGTMQGFRRFYLMPPDLKKVPWKDSDRPYKAFCQALETAELQPGEEYIVWLSFTSSKPQEVYLIFDVVPGEFPSGDVKDILKVLHID